MSAMEVALEDIHACEPGCEGGVASIEARLAALGVHDLRRVVGALPESNEALVLGRVLALSDDLVAVNKRIAAWQESALVIQRQLDRAKAQAATNIYHEWNGGEIADALQEVGL